MSDSEPAIRERRVPTPAFDSVPYRAYREVARTAPQNTVEVAVDTGRSVWVPRGYLLRLSCPDGPQVADVCFFNKSDPSEHLWANQTLNREGVYVTVGSRLWGTMPRFRPLATIVADTVADHTDPSSTPHHIVLGAHCNPWMYLVATGRDDHPNCYDQLCQAVDEAGISRDQIHDNINFFQRTRLDPMSHQYVTEPSGVVAGDYIELVAEVNLIVAISACPMGSARYRTESGKRDPLRLLAEVFAADVNLPEFRYVAGAGAL